MSLKGRPSPKLPWLDRSGGLSTLKLVVFVGLFLPGLWIALQWQMGWLMPKPVTEAIHQTGDWTVRLLLLSLLVTPLRRVANWGKLLVVRRMLGVAALAYAAIHLTLYVVDQKYDIARVASEIALRIYLTIGFVALLGLTALGATSTDAMVRRLGGKRWQALHNVVYGIGVLALVHFFLQSKIDVTQPILMTGFFIILMGYRQMVRQNLTPNPASLAGLAVCAGLATAFIEAGWYAVATGVAAARVLAANLELDMAIRPAWWVLAAGLALAAVQAARQRRHGSDFAGKRTTVRQAA